MPKCAVASFVSLVSDVDKLSTYVPGGLVGDIDSSVEVGEPFVDVRESLVKLEVNCFGFCSQT